MDKKIWEKGRDIPVKGEYDVVICGGGIAGISSALASARNGAKTLLIERSFSLGGLATTGLIAIYLPLCDGFGRQVSFGIVEELIRLSIKYGYEPCGAYNKNGERYCKAWFENIDDIEAKKQKRFRVQYNANVFAILCERLLIENGVDILYGSSVCGLKKKKNEISAVFVENKTGRTAYVGKSFVDATGDADLCKMAKERTGLYGQKNVIAGWYYQWGEKGYQLKQLGVAEIPEKYKTEEQKKSEKASERFQGIDGEELSRIMQISHKATLDSFLSEGGITENHVLTSITGIPQVRMSRRLVGKYTLDDVEEFKTFPDSIGMISDWRKKGPVYEVPFSTLVGSKIDNLSVCGRCISVTDAMWDISRVIPACAVTGQAAGTFASLYKKVSELDIKGLQKQLKKDGVKLHVDELEKLR